MYKLRARFFSGLSEMIFNFCQNELFWNMNYDSIKMITSILSLSKQ